MDTITNDALPVTKPAGRSAFGMHAPNYAPGKNAAKNEIKAKARKVLTPKQTVALANFDLLPPSARLETRVVALICGLGVSTLWKYVKLGWFPQGIATFGVRTTWSKAQIVEWLESRTNGVAA